MSADGNQYDVLASPTESKQHETNTRRGKDDIKEQAFQAREGLKNKAVELREQVTNTVNSKVEQVANTVNSKVEQLKAKAGLQGKDNDEIVEEATDAATEQWETVKRKTKHATKKAADQAEQVVDENLTTEQKAKLKKGLNNAQKGAKQAQKQAEGWSTNLINSTLSSPSLRPAKNFILKNNLQLPVVILGALLSLWLGLSIIRLITASTHPRVPEFDIHSKENSMNWLKYHAGEYKGKAVDMRDSLSGRAASFLANHEWEKLKSNAIDYKEIGQKRLGLAEPTWGEYAWAKLTGRPITWQDRVENVLNLAKNGIANVDVKSGLLNKIKNIVTPHEPTLQEKVAGYASDIKSRLPGQHVVEPTILESVSDKLKGGIDSIKAHIPGTEAARDAAEAARKAAYDATHPSTLDQIKSGATYVKNRIVHGSQEAAHIAQDRANELSDKAKYKAGL